jgi:hypothetical protein
MYQYKFSAQPNRLLALILTSRILLGYLMISDVKFDITIMSSTGQNNVSLTAPLRFSGGDMYPYEYPAQF